ncbi:SpoIIE family protein phosphatase [Streptomyces sp. NPDC046977]|uniref:ATP-binding SpoIIE family protein phosphatase n=1 Tax=Streptomyces sp. NPDC046977 TaxID=3154703 RepID=UPI0033C6947E
MCIEDVLSALGIGVWRWDRATDLVELDAVVAGLIGLAPRPQKVRSGTVRACYDACDYVDMSAAVALATAEGTPSESLLRVVGPDGSVVRTVAMRTRGTRTGGGEPAEMVGTLHEVPAVPGAPPGGVSTAVRAPADRRRAREAFLLDAGRALAEADSTQEVLRVAAHLSMPGFSPDGLAVFCVRGDHLSVIGHHGQQPGTETPFVEMPLTTDYPAAVAARTGQAVYLPSPEAYEEDFPATWPLVRGFGRRSWAYLPLVVAGRSIGAWMAAFREPVAFTPDERSVLTTVARMLAQALSRAQVHESERELSDGLRHTMLPTRRPHIDGMTVTTRYVPTGGGLQVGGDWYDVIDLPSGRTALVIGDVQGHDVRAAGLMGQLRIALRAYAAEGHGPDAVVSRTSRFLAGLTGCSRTEDDRFATCVYMEVDPVHGTLDVVRAGHLDPAVRLRDGTVLTRRTAGGLPLGIAPDSDYPTTRFTLEPGETLLICTDGLIETGGHDLDSGWERLRPVLESGPADDLEALADAMVGAVHGPASHHTTGPLADRRQDDIALLLLRRTAGAPVCEVPLRRSVLTVSQTDPREVAAAREEVRALLHDWTCAEQVDAAVLLVSELTSNVLLHTDEDAALSAQLRGMPGGRRRLRVDVRDRCDEMPHLRTPGETASSGRGLLLVQGLADAWGVDPLGDGKSIWFELYEAPTAPTAG